MEKQQLINSLSTTTGGYVCSTSSDPTKHNNPLLHNQVRLLSPPDERLESLSRLSSVAIAGDDSCSKSGNNSVLVTARKSSHKISSNNPINTAGGTSQSSFKGSNQQGRKITNPGTNSDVTTASSSATTIDPTLLLPKTKYNRRNNPDLEKRRIHFCDHPGIYVGYLLILIYRNLERKFYFTNTLLHFFPF